jgi:hypothetical protein
VRESKLIRSIYRIEYARTFKDELNPIIHTVLNVGTAASLAMLRPRPPEKIRIAVLDSGVDELDPKIRAAIKSKRIKSGKSWVDTAYNTDNYGHGTHVTRLLLDTAPRAEIYVAKICVNKNINDDFMPGIAEVCQTQFGMSISTNPRRRP